MPVARAAVILVVGSVRWQSKHDVELRRGPELGVTANSR